MPDRPILLLPRPVAAKKARQFGGAKNLHTPGMGGQRRRIEPQLRALHATFENRAVVLADSPGSEPAELLLVMETVGPVANFFRAVSKIPGLRWQLEWDEEVEPDENFFEEKDPEKPLQGFAYLVMGNQQAEVQLQQLWRLWVAGNPLPHGCAPWKDAFKLLRAIRPWSEEDRIRGTGMAEYAHEEIGLGRDLVPCEAELCFRESPKERLAAEQRVRRHVENAGGQVMSQFAHDGIRYHGVLFKVPPAAIQAMAELNTDIALLRADDVFLIRPAGQSLSPLPSPPLETPASVAPTRPTARPSKEAVAALLDGLPLQNHVLLRDRLVIVNPEAEYLGSLREHGTQMASVIIHGDLSANEPALDRPLVVRPIMVAAAPPVGVECLPEDRLVTDLVHQAVRDLIAGDTPAAPGVRIINLSIADRFAQFDRTVSSWAKMLDWLAYEHNLLFVVSAGNHDHSRDGALETDISRVDWPTLTVEQKQDAILRAIYADLRNRRLRPPSEAVNVLTVGSVARDDSIPGYLGAGFLPYGSQQLPAHYSAFGLGHRRMIKPELFVAGGRLPLREKLPGGPMATFENMNRFRTSAGIQVAAPGTAGQLDRTVFDRGTSHATALTTRAAVHLWDVLADLGTEQPGVLLPEYFPVLLKTLLVHGASWRHSRADLRRALGVGLTEAKFRKRVQHLLGFGVPDFARCAECTERRATVLGCGSLVVDQAHEFRVPLPPSLSGRLGLRRVTITLAYLSPVTARSQKYTAANLWFTVALKAAQNRTLLAVGRTDCDDKAAVRGAVQHEIFEGEEATVFEDEDFLAVQVNASEQAAGFQRPVRYGLAVSIEVGERVPVAVYEEVAARVRALVAIRSAVGSS